MSNRIASSHILSVMVGYFNSHYTIDLIGKLRKMLTAIYTIKMWHDFASDIMVAIITRVILDWLDVCVTVEL